jgi:hypothetical protein
MDPPDRDDEGSQLFENNNDDVPGKEAEKDDQDIGLEANIDSNSSKTVYL